MLLAAATRPHATGRVSSPESDSLTCNQGTRKAHLTGTWEDGTATWAGAEGSPRPRKALDEGRAAASQNQDWPSSQWVGVHVHAIRLRTPSRRPVVRNPRGPDSGCPGPFPWAAPSSLPRLPSNQNDRENREFRVLATLGETHTHTNAYRSS